MKRQTRLNWVERGRPFAKPVLPDLSDTARRHFNNTSFLALSDALATRDEALVRRVRERDEEIAQFKERCGTPRVHNEQTLFEPAKNTPSVDNKVVDACGYSMLIYA